MVSNNYRRAQAMQRQLQAIAMHMREDMFAREKMREVKKRAVQRAYEQRANEQRDIDAICTYASERRRDDARRRQQACHASVCRCAHEAVAHSACADMNATCADEGSARGRLHAVTD
jgi:hypothetical protein